MVNLILTNTPVTLGIPPSELGFFCALATRGGLSVAARELGTEWDIGASLTERTYRYKLST